MTKSARAEQLRLMKQTNATANKAESQKLWDRANSLEPERISPTSHARS